MTAWAETAWHGSLDLSIPLNSPFLGQEEKWMKWWICESVSRRSNQQHASRPPADVSYIHAHIHIALLHNRTRPNTGNRMGNGSTKSIIESVHRMGLTFTCDLSGPAIAKCEQVVVHLVCLATMITSNYRDHETIEDLQYSNILETNPARFSTMAALNVTVCSPTYTSRRSDTQTRKSSTVRVMQIEPWRQVAVVDIGLITHVFTRLETLETDACYSYLPILPFTYSLIVQNLAHTVTIPRAVNSNACLNLFLFKCRVVGIFSSTCFQASVQRVWGLPGRILVCWMPGFQVFWEPCWKQLSKVNQSKSFWFRRLSRHAVTIPTASRDLRNLENTTSRETGWDWQQ